MIIDLASFFHNGTSPIMFLKRFLDDIFMVYTGSIETLHQFLGELNKLHPTIKFTMNHTLPYQKENLAPPPTCTCKPESSLAFLDTSCQIVDGKIMVDLYKKETDRNQYLLTSSCHPSHVTNNIPFSLALRIVRICSLPEARDKRFRELKQMLLSRGYKPRIIDAAIEKARIIPRKKALERVVKEKTARRPVFVITYDPRLPSISKIVNKHYRTMAADPYLAEAFPLPPLIAYKRQKNIGDKAIRTKVPEVPPLRPKREIPGMVPCNNCPVCPFVKPGKVVKATATNYSTEINKKVSCKDRNIIYCVGCSICPMQYIGETHRSLQDRFSEHKGYVANNHLNKATGQHFNSKGHKIHHMTVTIVEKVFSNDPQYRKAREKMFIEKFNTKYKGMNKNR